MSAPFRDEDLLEFALGGGDPSRRAEALCDPALRARIEDHAAFAARARCSRTVTMTRSIRYVSSFAFSSVFPFTRIASSRFVISGPSPVAPAFSRWRRCASSR